MIDHISIGFCQDSNCGVLVIYNAPSVRNCNVVQYALDTLGFNHDDF